jgi:hypothetical protein
MELTVQAAGTPSGIAQVAAVWPDVISHKRHICYLALIGGLLRCKWTVPRVEQFVRELAATTNDEEAASRVADVASTAQCLEDQQPAYGWPRLAQELGEPTAVQIRVAMGAALTVETLSSVKKLPGDFLRGLGVRDGMGKDAGKVLIDYRDENGDVVTTRKRSSLAQRPYWAKGVEAVAYGRERLTAAAVSGYLVLVEGESDSWTLWHHRQPALGIPGAECTKVLETQHVAPFRTLYAVEEADKAGPDFIEGIRKRLGVLGWSGDLRVVRDFGAKDVSELYLQSPAHFLERWQAALADAHPTQVVAPPPIAPFLPANPPWPSPLAEEAYHGLAGDIVRVLEPASEADPVAMLIQLIVGFGNILGRTAHAVVEADKHFGNEFVVLVGKTAKARKGTSWGRINYLLRVAEEKWAKERVQTGLSSGEGLIWAVRDPIMKRERIKERGQPVRYEEVEADPGISDKRLLAVEPEYANVLKQIERQGNTLSAILRQAWESGDLRTLTKHSPTRSTGAHISQLGHITVEELRRYLTTTEMANGFGNRNLWVCVRRSKELPDGGTVDEAVLAELQTRLTDAIAFSRGQGAMYRDEVAREIWRTVYGPLSADRPGLSGALLGRAEAHVLRLSMLYALLDRSPTIGAPHLLAALAFWDYAEASVKHIWGDALGDPVADELLRLLRGSPDGLPRNQMRDYFSRHQSSERIGQALALLAEHRLARAEHQETNGRPREVWRATEK